MLREAWTAKDEFRYDLLLLDNSMPMLSGVDVIRASQTFNAADIVRRSQAHRHADLLLRRERQRPPERPARVPRRRSRSHADVRALFFRITLTRHRKPLLERNVRDVLDEAMQRRKDRLRSSRPKAPRMPSIGSTLDSGSRATPPPPDPRPADPALPP